MDTRSTKRFAAMLVAGVAGLAPALAGCGGSEPAKTAGTPSNSSSTSPSTSSVPSTVDVNSPSELASALKTLGVDTPTSEPIGTERSGPSDALAFPTWPAGEVRKAGLTTYRIDAGASYDNDGMLRFMDGKKVLYEAAFKPEHPETIAPIPPVVLESIQAGDTIKWGVWFTNHKMKPLTVDFKVIEKQGATKEVAKLDADKSVTKLARDLAKAQSLKNYSLFSEALVIYATVGRDNPTISVVYTPIMECLRSLKLKNTPLFEDAKSRAVGTPSVQRVAFGRGPSDGDMGHAGPAFAPIKPPTEVASSPGKKGLGQGGVGLKGKDETGTPYSAGGPAPTDAAGLANEAATHMAAFALGSRRRADEAANEAALLKAKSDLATTAATSARKLADDAAKKAADDKAKANDLTNGLSDAERAALQVQAALEGEAAKNAEDVAQAAEAAAKVAQDAANLAAENAAKLDAAAKEDERGSIATNGFISGFKPGPGVDPVPAPIPGPSIDSLKSLVKTTHDAVTAATKRFNDAGAALAAAQAAWQTASGNPATPPAVLTAAAAALAAAQAEQAAAQQGQLDAAAAAAAADAALSAAQGG